LEKRAKRENLSFEFLGYSGREEILSAVRDAMFQIVPSVWYEGFPMVILEAYACGTPVIASRIGSLAEVVVDGETGVHFMPGDPNDLAEKINSLRNDRPRLAAMRRKARTLFEEKYTAEKNFFMLMGIYERATENFKTNRRGRTKGHR
jgi:glycosyltransferase involved in cell wall biosynthesis